MNEDEQVIEEASDQNVSPGTILPAEMLDNYPCLDQMEGLLYYGAFTEDRKDGSPIPIFDSTNVSLCIFQYFRDLGGVADLCQFLSNQSRAYYVK